MKKIYFLLLAFGLFTGVEAQIINFPDANLKNKLLTSNCADFNNDGVFDGDVDVDNDGEIQVAEALNVLQLSIDGDYSYVSNLTGINSFVNLKKIIFQSVLFNNIEVDLTQLSQLEYVKISLSDTDLYNSINLSNLTHLVSLDLSVNRAYDTNFPNEKVNVNLSGAINLKDLTYFNSYVSFDFCQIPNLKNLNCWYLEGGEPADGVFDFSCLTQLETLTLGDNAMKVLILKNGSLLNSIINEDTNFHPLPKFICIDDNPQELQQIQNSGLVGPNTVVNSYCSFTPGGQYYTIKGNNKFDTNNDGCNESDIVYPNLKLVTNEIVPETIISDYSGGYSTVVQAGSVVLTPIIENTAFFNVTPSNIAVDFPAQTSPFIQNFCVTPNGMHSDVEVSILPLVSARPGFDAKYKIIYKNKGNQVENGVVTFNYDDTRLDFVEATGTPTQSTGALSWDFINLQPFKKRVVYVVLNVNSPLETPAVNGGDILSYTATIDSGNTDELPNDNTFELNQTVVNSFDPNDITCLEGASVSTAKVGDYVNYMIRFENTGSANATNIVVKDLVDVAKFDINTIVPIDGSHDYYTRIKGNNVEFIFENIDLPFDDANNDGYVAFKIKTKSTLVAGDTFSKNASIYFDYNFPIVTNTATTTIATLARQDFEFSNYFNLYPNPVHDVLNITTKDTIEISSINIYNTLGQLVLVIPNAKEIKTVDVSSLTTGNYFIKINSDKGTANTKFIKN